MMNDGTQEISVCLKFYISKNSCQSFLRPSLVLPKADYHSGGRKYRNIASLTPALSFSLSHSFSLISATSQLSLGISLLTVFYSLSLSRSLTAALAATSFLSLFLSLSHSLEEVFIYVRTKNFRRYHSRFSGRLDFQFFARNNESLFSFFTDSSKSLLTTTTATKK